MLATRRQLLAASLCIVGAPPAIAQPGAPREPSEQRDAWMRAWMDSGRSLSGALFLGRFKDPYYYLLKPIRWTANHPATAPAQQVTVPAGFVTDLASIPPVFWSALRPDGDYAYAAILHDYLYWEQPLSRSQADEVFRLAMEDLGIGSTVRQVIVTAVRTWGEGPWEANRAARRNGERRVLKKQPDDPRVTWQQWRTVHGAV